MTVTFDVYLLKLTNNLAIIKKQKDYRISVKIKPHNNLLAYLNDCE
jgi:hypothetical protein